jgi:hypothetical protein
MPVPSGYSGTPLVQKLGIKPGFCIFVAGAPADYAGITGKLPDGVTIVPRLAGAIDMVHLFAASARGLGDKLKRYRVAIKPDGMVWVSWPKKSSGVSTDLSEVTVRETALPLGLVDIKVCAVDATWAGLKFVIPKAQRVKRPR